jgi:2-methylcitrate dehydratase PrpD
MSITTHLAEQGLTADPLAIPGAMAKAKTCLIDFLSCAFEARNLPWSRQAIGLASPLAEGCTIIGTDIRCAPTEAGFANAVLGHGLVREDMHAAAISHLGVVVWPTVLALSQQTPVNGRDFLATALVGYEAGGRIGRALMSRELARLFRPTGLVGPLAGALAGSRMVGLGKEAAASAMALAANTSAGLNQWPHTGGSEMYFHPGFAARNALACVALAKAGAVASPDILEGEAGLVAAFARRPLEGEIELFPDGKAEILEVFNKPVPACNFAQSPCQAALRALELAGGSSGRITAVAIETSDAAVQYPGCDGTGPFRYPLQAKKSIPFGVAATLAQDTIAESNYDRLDDAEIDRLISVTRLDSEGSFSAAFPAAQGARVTLTLQGGECVVGELDDVVFATPDQVRERFLSACGECLGAGRASEVMAFVDGLENQAVPGDLASLCTAPSA